MKNIIKASFKYLSIAVIAGTFFTGSMVITAESAEAAATGWCKCKTVSHITGKKLRGGSSTHTNKAQCTAKNKKVVMTDGDNTGISGISCTFKPYPKSAVGDLDSGGDFFEEL